MCKRFILVAMLASIVMGCSVSPGPSALESTPLLTDHATLKQAPQPIVEQPTTLPELINLALRTNPRLSEVALQVEAAWAKAPQVASLPDPMVSANVYAHPIETAAGSMRANLSFSQRFPWWPRLQAQEQKAAVEASMLQETLKAEQLRIIAEVKSLYFRLYLLGQQIRINEENQKSLASIIRVELKRVGAAGKKTAVNDTLRSSVENSQLEQELLDLKQRKATTIAQINRLLNRPATTPLTMPTSVEISYQSPKLKQLSMLATHYQPELTAAVLRSEAARLGIEIADIQHIPDLTVSLGWWAIDDNRPASRVVEVGGDAWAVGVSVNVPIWQKKYEAARQEARARHASSLASVEDLQRRYEALLAELLEKAKAADETARLYDKAILPQARLTLSTDQKSYGAGEIDFDRLMNDLRNLRTLEVNYHRARAELATAIARIEQAIGLPWTKIFTEHPLKEHPQVR